MNPLFLAGLLLLPAAVRAEDPPAVLFIGDSHSTMGFGKALYGDLHGKGNAAVFAVCSSRPQSFLSETEHACGYYMRGFDGKEASKYVRAHPGKIKVNGSERDVTFVKTPKLSDLLADYRPLGVIVALGSNGLSAASVKQTLAVIHGAGADCFWVGPPHMRTVPDATLDGYYKILADNKVSANARPGGDACRLILDSRTLNYLVYPAQGGDGTHYATGDLAKLATRWGHDAYKAFAEAIAP